MKIERKNNFLQDKLYKVGYRDVQPSKNKMGRIESRYFAFRDGSYLLRKSSADGETNGWGDKVDYRDAPPSKIMMTEIENTTKKQLSANNLLRECSVRGYKLPEVL